MTRTILITSLMIACLSPAWAAEECCPADAAKTSANGNLPAGHPPIGGMQLPPGHPEIPAAQPGATGILTIRGIQGTVNGPVVAGNKVTVELYHAQKVIKTIETQLDEHGVVIIEDVPLDVLVQPVVNIEHLGTAYQAMGKPMVAEAVQQQVDVTVYEATEEAPAWKLPMRHIMVGRDQKGLVVNDVSVVHSASDRTWVGKTDANGGRTTTVFTLDPSARDIRVGKGYDACCTKISGNQVINTKPLRAGKSQYQVTYAVPSSEKTSIAITAPADIDHLMVFVPDDQSKVSLQGLEPSGTFDMGNGSVRTFKAEQVKAGSVVTLTLEAGVVPAAAAPAPTGNSAAPKIIAAAGGGAILLIGAVMMLVKTPRAAERRPRRGKGH